MRKEANRRGRNLCTVLILIIIILMVIAGVDMYKKEEVNDQLASTLIVLISTVLCLGLSLLVAGKVEVFTDTVSNLLIMGASVSTVILVLRPSEHNIDDER